MKMKLLRPILLILSLLITSVNLHAEESAALQGIDKLLEKRISFTDEEEIILIQKEETDPIEFVQIFFDIEYRLQSLNVDAQNPLVSIDKNVESYVELLRLYHEYKELSARIGKLITRKIENEEALSGDDLYFIKKTLTLYYILSKKILSYSELHAIKDLNLSERINAKMSNDPILKSYLIHSTGMVLILDHFLDLYPIYYGNGYLRRIVKSIFKNHESDMGNNKTFDDLIDLLKDVVEVNKNKKFRQNLLLMKKSYKDLTEIFERDDQAMALTDVLTSNPRLPEIIDGTLDIPNKRYTFVDMFYSLASAITDTISKIFGNLSGSIRWRAGYLANNEAANQELKSKLKPMDIILEKTPFALTDKFIPGHFGHVALYLGTKAELEALGIWDHPSLEPYKHDIENGKVILEAVRSGVRLATLEEFMNIDEIAILRKSDILQKNDDLYEAVLRGMLQIGKDYDFNFDVETLDKIVCSELIYLVFGNVAWPTKYQLQRNTISPDDVGEIQYYLGSKFSMETYFNAEKDQKLNKLTKFDLSPKLGFESDGKDENGQDIFAKKSTKCYTTIGTRADDGKKIINRSCRVTKRRYVYQELQFGYNN